MFVWTYFHKLRWKRSKEKYTIVKLEVHACRWVAMFVDGTIHLALASFFVELEVFFPP
jgi:hypothetical protein